MSKIRIKGFTENLQSYDGYQFEIGKEYKIETNEPLNIYGKNVFHYCETLAQVNYHYSCRPLNYNRYCYIEVLGEEVFDGRNLYGSNHIKILREITGKELKQLKKLTNGNLGLFNSGYYNTGDYNKGNRNTGDRNKGDCNTGYDNQGDYNVGNNNIGKNNTGCNNQGDYNVGGFNKGDYNVGFTNLGVFNVGDNNKGNCNVGNNNQGNYNIGDFNKCDHSTGFFNTQPVNVILFNKDSGMTWEEFIASEYYEAILFFRFILRNPKGKYNYREACVKRWKLLPLKTKKLIKSLPNFDPVIFKEITGITVKIRQKKGKK